MTASLAAANDVSMDSFNLDSQTVFDIIVQSSFLTRSGSLTPGEPNTRRRYQKHSVGICVFWTCQAQTQRFKDGRELAAGRAGVHLTASCAAKHRSGSGPTPRRAPVCVHREDWSCCRFTLVYWKEDDF